MTNNYDVIVLGSGPGGYVAAIKASQRGLKTAIIEKQFFGGTCLNIGCIPTKALLASAETYKSFKKARDFGITVEGTVGFDFSKIMARKERVVKQLRGGVEFLMKKNNINILAGLGTLVNANTIKITNDEGEAEITAENIILATGSVPSRPPIKGIDGDKVLTSDELLFIENIPRRLRDVLS